MVLKLKLNIHLGDIGLDSLYPGKGRKSLKSHSHLDLHQTVANIDFFRAIFINCNMCKFQGD